MILDTIPTAAWRAEAGAVSESDPAFRGVVMVPRSLAFRFKVSRELLADGVGIEDALKVAIAQAFAKELDRVALRGQWQRTGAARHLEHDQRRQRDVRRRGCHAVEPAMDEVAGGGVNDPRL